MRSFTNSCSWRPAVSVPPRQWALDQPIVQAAAMSTVASRSAGASARSAGRVAASLPLSWPASTARSLANDCFRVDHGFAMMTGYDVANDAVSSANRSSDLGVAIDFAVVDHGRDDIAGCCRQSSRAPIVPKVHLTPNLVQSSYLTPNQARIYSAMWE